MREPKKILKYKVDYYKTNHGGDEIILPAEHKILSCQFQNGQLVIWAFVDPNVAPIKRVVHAFETGENAERCESMTYLTTLQIRLGGYVSHIFITGR